MEYPVEVANDDITKLATLLLVASSKEAVKFASDGGDELYNLNTIFSPTVKLVVGIFKLKVYDSYFDIYFNIGMWLNYLVKFRMIVETVIILSNQQNHLEYIG